MITTKQPPVLTPQEIGALGLRPREVEVLYLIAAGCSTSDIAAALYLSVNSIKTHTQSVFKKIGVTTRLQAAVWVWSRAGDHEVSSPG
jgi:DNA-binding NarL/FixJ family response regulator